MLQIITTSDGSHTIKHSELDETYHSIHGAIQESDHVFIKSGLNYLIDNCRPSEIKILEVGFGTGLNALLTLLNDSSPEIKIEYEAIELFPLSREIITQLNYPSLLAGKDVDALFKKLHECPWEKWESITSNFKILKRQTDLQEFLHVKSQFDLVYFDAFAPSKQAELWRVDVLRPIIDSLRRGGIFVTYSAKGQLKRDLKNLGMEVEILEGPPGKMQMTRAIKI